MKKHSFCLWFRRLGKQLSYRAGFEGQTDDFISIVQERKIINLYRFPFASNLHSFTQAPISLSFSELYMNIFILPIISTIRENE